MGPNYSTFVRKDPIVEDPRNPFVEGILNIAKILEDSLSLENLDNRFGQPFIKRVHKGALHAAPEVYPVVDIVFIAREREDKKEQGSHRPSMEWPCIYEVRYWHSILDRETNDLEILRNLYRIVDVLEYDNTMNGLCPRNPAKVQTVNFGPSLNPEFPDALFVAGGIITLRLPINFQRTYWDGGASDRETVFSGGPNVT